MFGKGLGVSIHSVSQTLTNFMHTVLLFLFPLGLVQAGMKKEKNETMMYTRKLRTGHLEYIFILLKG